MTSGSEPARDEHDPVRQLNFDSAAFNHNTDNNNNTNIADVDEEQTQQPGESHHLFAESSGGTEEKRKDLAEDSDDEAELLLLAAAEEGQTEIGAAISIADGAVAATADEKERGDDAAKAEKKRLKAERKESKKREKEERKAREAAEKAARKAGKRRQRDEEDGDDDNETEAENDAAASAVSEEEAERRRAIAKTLSKMRRMTADELRADADLLNSLELTEPPSTTVSGDAQGDDADSVRFRAAMNTVREVLCRLSEVAPWTPNDIRESGIGLAVGRLLETGASESGKQTAVLADLRILAHSILDFWLCVVFQPEEQVQLLSKRFLLPTGSGEAAAHSAPADV